MRVLIIIILIVIVNTANCQDEKKKDFFIDELYISYNRSVNVNTVSKDGFGIGLKILILDSENYNVVMGLSFNRTNQFNSHLILSSGNVLSNVTHNINSLSFPMYFRYYFDSSNKYFFQTGIFVDVMKGRVKGDYVDIPKSGFGKTSYIDRDASLNNPVLGLHIGFGVIIPMLGQKFILKPDFKFVLNNLLGYNYTRDYLGNWYSRISIGIKI